MATQYDRAAREEWRSRLHWFYEHFRVYTKRRPKLAHPSIDPNTGHCRDCKKQRLQGNFEDWNIRCHLCARVFSRAPVLDHIALCGCKCNRYNPSDAVSDEIVSANSGVEVDEDHPSDVDTPASPANSDLSVPDDRVISTAKACNLGTGLTAWEQHDLMILGHSATNIKRQFPEVIAFGRGNQTPVPRARPFLTCLLCRKDRLPEVEIAIMKDQVELYRSYGGPRLYHEQAISAQALLDSHSCLCYCGCAPTTTPADPEPIFFPYIMSKVIYMPSPATRKPLSELGYCFRDTEAEQYRDAVAPGLDKPSYTQVINGTIRAWLVETSHERLGRFRDHIQNSYRFPNGVLRDRSTNSGVPHEIEEAMRKLHGNDAWDEQTTRVFKDGPDLSGVLEMSSGDRKRWNRYAFLVNRRQVAEVVTTFAIWAATFGDSFGLQDSDGDSLCSIDELGEEAWREVHAGDFTCQCGNSRCAEAKYQMRHMRRKFEWVGTRGGFHYSDADAAGAVSMEDAYQLQREFDGDFLPSTSHFLVWPRTLGDSSEDEGSDGYLSEDARSEAYDSDSGYIPSLHVVQSLREEARRLAARLADESDGDGSSNSNDGVLLNSADSGLPSCGANFRQLNALNLSGTGSLPPPPAQQPPGSLSILQSFVDDAERLNNGPVRFRFSDQHV